MSLQLSTVFVQQQVGVLFFGALVVLWAVLRPPMIRDDDECPLPPHVVVRVVLVILYLALYLALVGTASIGGQLFVDAAELLLTQTWYGYVQAYVTQIRTYAPGFAFLLLLAPMSLVPVRELERRFLVWMHRGSHLGEDGQLLARHLAHGPFEPSEAERRRSLTILAEHDVVVTDTDTRTIRLVSVEHWRKVNALLGLLHAWNTPQRSYLNKAQQRQLRLLTAAHERKTRLALGIVTLLAQDSDRGRALSRVGTLLGAAPHGDDAAVAGIEGELAGMLDRAALEPAGRPGETVRLASADLQRYLEPINAYFAVEYTLMLDDLAQLASASLVHAGDLAASRLDDLKAAGFADLGTIERMDIPRLLLVLIGAAVSGFLILLLFRLRQNAGMDPDYLRMIRTDTLISLGAFSLALAVAALIGAYIGSNTRIVRAPRPPWGRYLRAGLFAVLAFFLVTGAQIAVFGDPTSKRRAAMEAWQAQVLMRTTPSLTADEAAEIAAGVVARRMPTAGRSRPLLRRAPFALMPFLLVIGMCMLARGAGYWAPGPIARSPLAAKVWERTLDGLVVSAVLATACGLAFAVAMAIGTMPAPPPPTAPPLPGAGGPPNPLYVVLQLAIVGFAIGALVMRDVRLAAHTRMVLADADPGPAAEPPTPAAPHGGIPTVGHGAIAAGTVAATATAG
jgi:hypothetical protein